MVACVAKSFFEKAEFKITNKTRPQVPLTMQVGFYPGIDFLLNCAKFQNSLISVKLKLGF